MGDEVIDSMMQKCRSENGLSVWTCTVCSKETTRKHDLKRHVEATHVMHPGVACEVCGHMCKTRDSLRHHFSAVHKY